MKKITNTVEEFSQIGIKFPKPKKEKKKKVKALTVSKAKKRAWTAFSLYIRTKGSDRGTNRCVTCNRVYPITALQAGHWIPGRHNSVLFDERNCHPQCYGCNVPMKGNPIKYYHFMEETYNKKVMKELEELDKQEKQFKVYELLEIERMYNDKLEALNFVIPVIY